MAEWYTADDDERLLAAWSDAPIENTETCGFLLDTAKDQVLAYAPELEPEVTVVDGIIQSVIVIPDRYVYAQLQQAKNLWNAGRASSDGDLGDGGYTFTPRPLDKTIRSIIRPTDIRPDAY